MNRNLSILIGLTLIISACQNLDERLMFELLDAEKTGVDFVNELEFDREFNIYKYRNFYNGGGVGIGDFNNDGLKDIYFSANMKTNKLYFNKGNFEFEDVSAASKTQSEKAWSTGVSVADVDGDGWLDIYVCNSGDIEGDDKMNELFINNQDGTFTEKAEDFGLADKGYSTHAAFFDYDRDGDLDAYLLNNSYQSIGSFNLKKNERPNRDIEGGDKLYRNDDGTFVDVSEDAGIYGSIIGFGLGVTVGDVNRDGWLDLYISNDFFERDYLYINNKDGTFSEELTAQINSISGASMGADMADVNNDGYPEIFVTEMLPRQEQRIKTKTTFENWDRYQQGVQNGYYHQFTRNMFHLNNGNNTFSEIGRMSNVHATDWSWGALIADFDNDGYKDLYVSNGINQDLTDQDFLKYIANEETMRAIISDEGVDYAQLIEAIPSNRIKNYMMANNGNSSKILFTDTSEEWGLGHPSFSNGSAYADLDNDGDLDIVVNNVNMSSFIYRNNQREHIIQQHNYLQVDLVGRDKNKFAVGSNVSVYANEEIFYSENIPIRGFQSSVDNTLHFGLGHLERIDSVIVNWYDGSRSSYHELEINQRHKIEIENVDRYDQESGLQLSAMSILNTEVISAADFLDYKHTENEFVDFDRDRLLFQMISSEGPCFCKGDINGDGLEDLYLGGSKDHPGQFWLQRQNGKYEALIPDQFLEDKISEDSDCRIFDMDADGDMDLYVASGSNEFPSSSSALGDRAYFNDGSLGFTKSSQILPAGLYESTGSIDIADYDGDGDIDVLVGLRLKPFLYGVPVSAYILDNDGKGKFTKVANENNGVLKDIGLVKDLMWVDFDSDEDLDIIIIGEWMPISVLENTEEGYKNITKNLGLEKSNGWWNKLEVFDIDNDGDKDFVIGNHGLNSRFKATIEKPIRMYINDFDQNGQVEQIICTYNGEEAYPIALKHDLEMQMPELKKQFLKYTDYAGKTIGDIFPEEILERSIVGSAYELRSSILINNGSQKWELRPLDIEAQVSPVYGIKAIDLNNDGLEDLILGGNLYKVKPEIGRFDASYGQVLINNGKNTFESIKSKQSNIEFNGEIRHIETITISGENALMAIRNNDTPLIYILN